MDFKGAWEGLTTEYDRRTGVLTFYATPNAEKAIRDDPGRIEEWVQTIEEQAQKFADNEIMRICTSSRS